MLAHNDKYVLQQHILDNLFAAEERRLGNIITDLDRQNREIAPAQNYGFHYEGQIFVPPGAPKLRGRQRPALHFSLEPQVKALQQDQERCQLDKKLIGQMLFTLTHQCNDDQEKRDALPDCLVQFAPPAVKALSRRFEHQDMLSRILNLHPSTLRQYAEIEQKIQMYVAGQFIY